MTINSLFITVNLEIPLHGYLLKFDDAIDLQNLHCFEIELPDRCNNATRQLHDLFSPVLGQNGP